MEKKKSLQIDFIMPWVDGNDLEWQSERKKYNNEKTSDASIARYRDWDNLQYWFRGVEKFTPWVNKIHFITYGHLPKWLNIKHNKLQIVNHKDYIPAQYLPVFNVNPIELNLHRIPNLSNHFVYFNDDCFILKPMKPYHFFKNGLPCDTAALTVLGNSELTQDIPKLNIMHIINKHFSKQDVIYGHKNKWFNLKNGTPMIRTLLLLPWKFIPNIYSAHGPNSYTKKVFNTLWEKEYDVLNQTCNHKFREITDVTQILFKAWQLCEGYFEPQNNNYKSYSLLLPYNQLKKIILGNKISVVCLNDDNDIKDFEKTKMDVNNLLNQILPEKSSFEL